MTKFVHSANSDTLHMLSKDGPRDTWVTLCGRNAQDWFPLTDDMSEAKFIEYPWACSRCVAHTDV